MEKVLYKRSKTGAIQKWKAYSIPHGYNVEFGQLNGKIQGTITTIKEGKQKRTREEQIAFEIAALYKGKKDEGYKALEDLHTITPDDPQEIPRFLNDFLPIFDTTKDGHLRPMLAKTLDPKKVKFPIGYEDKLDGVRCNILLVTKEYEKTKDITHIGSLAREGGSYDFGTFTIRQQLKEFFNKYPDVVLDGELYVHGMPQNQISGAMRGGKYKSLHDIMEYHVYDMIDTTMEYEERKNWLEVTLAEFNMPLVKYHPFRIAFSQEDIDFYEEESIANGYEGGMLKPLKSMYEPGKRSWSNMKVKRWLDDEFKIVGYELGKRGAQDLVIKCETKKGQEFGATAMGTIAEKEEMLKRLKHDEISKDHGLPTVMLGKMGTVKYKFLSEYGVPNHTNFKGVREGRN